MAAMKGGGVPGLQLTEESELLIQLGNALIRANGN